METVRPCSSAVPGPNGGKRLPRTPPSSMCGNSAYEPATPVWAWKAAWACAPARADALALPHPAHSGPQTRRERCRVSSSRRADAYRLFLERPPQKVWVASSGVCRQSRPGATRAVRAVFPLQRSGARAPRAVWSPHRQTLMPDACAAAWLRSSLRNIACNSPDHALHPPAEEVEGVEGRG